MGQCALCRRSFGELPFRVLRKAVLEMREHLGASTSSFKRWRAASYYDQVYICALCSQFLVPDRRELFERGRYGETPLQLPVRKSANKSQLGADPFLLGENPGNVSAPDTRKTPSNSAAMSVTVTLERQS